MNDYVSYDLAMELVEMLMPGAGRHYEAAGVMGVSTASIGRYRNAGRVPREIAEAMYDRIAHGLGPRKPKQTEWEWPLDYDERADLARRHYRQAS